MYSLMRNNYNTIMTEWLRENDEVKYNEILAQLLERLDHSASKYYDDSY